MSYLDKIITLEEAPNRLGENRSSGFCAVLTNGVFDILHVGHTRYLEKAKSLGDVLIVGVNTDSSVRMNKSSDRPFISQSERAEIIASLGCVDLVCLFDSKTPLPLIRAIKPHVYCKGSDYTLTGEPGKSPIFPGICELVSSYGGRIELIDVESDMSTSEIAKRIRRP